MIFMSKGEKLYTKVAESCCVLQVFFKRMDTGIVGQYVVYKYTGIASALFRCQKGITAD
jgi:hypothetical protein